MAKKNKHSGRIIIFILLVVFLLIWAFGNKTWWRLMVLYKNVRVLEQEIAKVEKENKELDKEISRLKTDYNYIEKIARDELGLIRPGEKEYNFIPPRGKNQTK